MIDVVTCSRTEPWNPRFNDKCRNLLIDVTKQVFFYNIWLSFSWRQHIYD